MRSAAAGFALFLIPLVGGLSVTAQNTPHKTRVAIVRDAFHINGKPTYQGRTWQGHKVEGLLFNSRMVQATFDDLNAETRSRWSYPDTKSWDADRNTRELIAAVPAWRRHASRDRVRRDVGGSTSGYHRDDWR